MTPKDSSFIAWYVDGLHDDDEARDEAEDGDGDSDADSDADGDSDGDVFI